MIILFQTGLVSCTRRYTGEGFKGCKFHVSYQLMDNPEPEAESLSLAIDILIIGLREVSNSGGSFGVDAEYDLIAFYITHN